MSAPVVNGYGLDQLPAEQPVTIKLHLSPAEVELAMANSGLSLCLPAMRALVMARVLDFGWLKPEAKRLSRVARKKPRRSAQGRARDPKRRLSASGRA